jgi:hypothetical protein
MGGTLLAKGRSRKEEEQHRGRITGEDTVGVAVC